MKKGMLILFILVLLFISSCAFNIQKSPNGYATAAKVGDDPKLAFSIPSVDQVESISFNKHFDEDKIVDIDIPADIIAIAFSGRVLLSDKSSYARIIVNPDNERLLGYATDELLDELEFTFEYVCAETCVMDPMLVDSLEIQVGGGEVFLESIEYLTVDNNLMRTSAEVREEQQLNTIGYLNERIEMDGLYWVAGDTIVSRLPFREKEKLFKGHEYGNIGGFFYYKGGYYSLPWYEFSDEPPTQSIRNDDAFNFSWRERHGQDWMTPVGCQMGCFVEDHIECGWWHEDCEDAGYDWRSCGSCWAFSSVGLVESGINLYYNQHIDKNLSEQDLVSCGPGYGCSGGQPSEALEYIRNTGIPDEACFQYVAQDDPCSDKCSDWESRSWRISSYEYSFLSYRDFSLKIAIFEKGPISFTTPFFGEHAMLFVGFGEIIPGYYLPGGEIPEGNPLIGKTYWLVKNSWGNDWGEDGGYGRFIFLPPFEVYRLSYFIDPIPPSIEPYSISCVDFDDDGICWWGVTSEKPSDCPSSCVGSNEKDCDDSNSLVGVCDENYICGNNLLLPSGEVRFFGDYEEYYQLACCGDNFDEYPLEHVCCDNPTDVEIPNGPEQFSCARLDGCSEFFGATEAIEHSPLFFNMDEDPELEIVAASTEKIYVWNCDGSLVPGWPVDRDNYISPVIGDIDGDDMPEIISGWTTTYVLNHDGTMVDGWPKSDGARTYSLGDIDRDGILDIIGAAHTAYDRKVYVWNGDGTLVDGWPQEVAFPGSISDPPTIGDVDGDGNNEIIVASYSDLYVWNGDGTLVDGWPQHHQWFESTTSLGNIDNDEELEIIITGTDGVFVYNYDGTLVDGWPQPIEGYGSYSNAIGDIDNDGELEIVVVDYWNYVYVWNGDGTLVDGWPIDLPGIVESSLVIGDIDNDNLLEIIISETEDYDMIYILGVNGSVLMELPVDGDIVYSSPLISDIDDDGDTEILISAGNYVLNFDLSSQINKFKLDWPMFHHDVMSTGRYTWNCGNVLHGECSTIQPLYCDNGELVDNCQRCGCPLGKRCAEDGSCKRTKPPLPHELEPG